MPRSDSSSNHSSEQRTFFCKRCHWCKLAIDDGLPDFCRRANLINSNRSLYRLYTQNYITTWRRSDNKNNREKPRSDSAFPCAGHKCRRVARHGCAPSPGCEFTIDFTYQWSKHSYLWQNPFGFTRRQLGYIIKLFRFVTHVKGTRRR